MMQHEGHVRILKSLKLFGMAHAIEELGNQNSPAFNQALPMLDSLIKAEVAEREVRSVNYQLRVAKFPVYRDLVGFDFSQSLVNEATVKQLHRCDFMEQAQNVVLIGGPGTGKTHLATAIGTQAVMHLNRRVRFFSTVAKFAQRAKNVKLALNSKITHLNSRSQSALASNILVQHIEQPMHRYLFLRLMD